MVSGMPDIVMPKMNSRKMEELLRKTNPASGSS
jgi:hypothetical protein